MADKAGKESIKQLREEMRIRQRRERQRLESVLTTAPPTSAPPFVAPRPVNAPEYIPIPTYEDPDEHLGVFERLYAEISRDWETRPPPSARDPQGPWNLDDVARDPAEYGRRYTSAARDEL